MDIHPRPNILLFLKRSCNFNITTDNTLVKQFPCNTFIIQQIRIWNASISLTTAAGGIYTDVTKGGIAVVAAGQVYSSLTGSTLGTTATLTAAGQDELTASALYLSLTTAQGSAATADVAIFGWAMS